MNKQKNQEKTLVREIGNTVAIVLVVVFLCLIVTTVMIFSFSMNDAITDSLSETAENTANQIEAIFADANVTTGNMETYLTSSNQIEAEGYSNMAREKHDTDDSRIYRSMIYDAEISEINSDVEKYLIETARSTVVGENSVIGVGVMFNPYCYDSHVESYAFYIDESIESDGIIQTFGNYSDYSKESYYLEAVKQKKRVFTNPYDYNGHILITCAVPIIYNGEVQGVVMADVKVEDFSEFVINDPAYPSMYTTVYNSNYIDIYDSDSLDDVGRSMDEFYAYADELAEVKTLMEKGDNFQITTTRENGEKVVKFFAPISVGDDIWWSMTALSKKDKEKQIVQMLFVLIIVSVISLAVIMLVLIRALNRKLKPIKGVVDAANEIVKGNLNVEVTVETKDEIGKVAFAFQNMINGLKVIITDIDYLLSEMANGNFDIRTKEEESYVGEYQNILLSIRKLNKNLSGTLTRIVDSSDQVALGAGQMAVSAQSLAEGATEQAEAVEELTTTIESVSSEAIRSAGKAQEAYQRAEHYVSEAEQSNQQMKQLNLAMERISDTSKQIAQIISEIEDIASQTNLLSLNASIEAARAGEAGKGFAVVADQIGKLAADSAKSAVNTRELIENALSEVETGSEMTAQTTEAMEHVIDGIRELAQNSKENSDISLTQSETMKQVEEGVEQISSVVQSNSAAAQETSATSEELSAQADTLKSLVSNFKLRK